MGKGKGRAPSSLPPQKRGRKPTIKGVQKAAIDKFFVPLYIVQALSSKKGAVKEKTAITDNCTKYVRAKYGSRDPWRALDTDPDEPPPNADTDADDTASAEGETETDTSAEQTATSLSVAVRSDLAKAEEAGARLVAIRTTIAAYMRKCAKAAKDEAGSLLIQNSEEGQKARLDAVIAAVVGNVQAKPERKRYLEAFAELYGEDDWEEEAEERWEEKKLAAQAQGELIPLAPHVRRDLIREKWADATEEERLHTREEIEKQYQAGMQRYEESEDSQQHEPQTPEEAAHWGEDFEPVLARAGQVFADGVKGCFFALMASPRMTEDGRVEMEVSTVEWASVPKELGRRTFNYSAIDRKMVKKIVSRFKYFGERIYDANWTAEQFKRDDICRDLVEREASGKGVMDEPTDDSGAPGPSDPSRPARPSAPQASPRLPQAPAPAAATPRASPTPQPATTAPRPSPAPQPAPAAPQASPAPQPAPAAPQASPAPQPAPASPQASPHVQKPSPPDSIAPVAVAPSSKNDVRGESDRMLSNSVGRPSIPPQAARAIVSGSLTATAATAAASGVVSEQAQVVGLDSVFARYDPRDGLELSELQDTAAFGLWLTSAVKALAGLPNDETLFSGKASWRKMLLDANDNSAEGDWNVDTRIFQNLLREYLMFETEGAAVARTAFIRWSSFSVNGEDSELRPVWMVKFYAKDKYTARWCEIGSKERPSPAARTLEWNFGVGLTMQWANLQPEQRRSGAFVLTGPPDQGMDWQGAMEGGRMGMRTFVAGLLMWAHVLPSCEDGSTSDHWERLASDCIRVLRIRRKQESSAPRGAPQSNAGGEAPKVVRKRNMSAKALENAMDSGEEKEETVKRPRSKKRKTAQDGKS